MACLAVGGPEQFARAPLFVVYIEPSSPLTNSRDALEKLLYAADNGIPLSIRRALCVAAPHPPLCRTHGAVPGRSLTGVVLAQLRRRGAAVIIGGLVSIMDMGSTIMSYGAPEMTLLSAAMTEVAGGSGCPCSRLQAAGL